MPTNLPAEAIDAERRYRSATSVEEKIACLQELLSAIPKHKGTDRLRAGYRQRLSKLQAASQGHKGHSKRESVYHIAKAGAGQVMVIGPTNVGKSALVATLTNAAPDVAPFPYTTWKPLPGMMPFEDIQIQLVDTPPLQREHVEHELYDLIRRADLILLVVDLGTDPLQQLEDTIALLEEQRIVPGHFQERGDDQGRYTDRRRPTFIPLLVLVNKADDADADEDFQIFCELLEDDWPLLPVSATTGRNLERLKRVVFEQLEIMRIYSKRPGKAPDLDAPFVLKQGSTVADLAGKVHKDFHEQLKTARVWGSGVFDGQRVRRDHVLHDGDVVELRI